MRDRGSHSARASRTRRTTRCAIHRPSSQPQHAMMTLSASDAPHEVAEASRRAHAGTAHSRCRAAARPARSPDTFAHAINNTSTAPARNGTTVVRALSCSRSASGTMAASRFLIVGAVAASISPTTRRASSRACSGVTPGASRPTRRNRRWSRDPNTRSSGTASARTHTSTSSPGNVKRDGRIAATPKSLDPSVSPRLRQSRCSRVAARAVR